MSQTQLILLVVGVPVAIVFALIVNGAWGWLGKSPKKTASVTHSEVAEFGFRLKAVEGDDECSVECRKIGEILVNHAAVVYRHELESME